MKFRIRMFWCILLAALLLAMVWAVAPEQGPVILYKQAIVLLAAFCGYWIDRWAFPYARPDRFLTVAGDARSGHRRVFAAAGLRRAIIMGSTMLAVGLGL